VRWFVVAMAMQKRSLIAVRRFVFAVDGQLAQTLHHY
jgi:hypothetical protein